MEYVYRLLIVTVWIDMFSCFHAHEAIFFILLRGLGGLRGTRDAARLAMIRANGGGW